MRMIREGFYILYATYFLTGCVTWSPELERAGPPGSSNWEKSLSGEAADPEAQIAELFKYAGRSAQWRSRSMAAYQHFHQYQQAHHGKISSNDLFEINQLIEEYVRHIRNPLVDLTQSHFFFMDLERAIVLQTDTGTFIEHAAAPWDGALEDEWESAPPSADAKLSRDIYHINPLDREGQNALRQFHASFAAALVLLDNYALGLDPYMNDTALRRSLFYDIPGLDEATRDALRAFRRNYQSYRNSAKLLAAFNLYQKVRRMEEATSPGAGVPHTTANLHYLIETSMAFREMVRNPEKEGFFDRVVQSVKGLLRSNGDRLNLIGHQAKHVMGKAFGHSASLFQSRDGKLKHMPEPEVRSLARQLKSLDILIEKSSSRLTDKLIPGHYGHLAIWVGTEEELKALEVWDQLPALYRIAVDRYSYKGPSFQAAVHNGKSMVEALRQGVHFHSLRHFLDIDDLAVLRARECGRRADLPCMTLQAKRRYLLNVFSQIGKNYDFNFDVNTKGELICSEVAYHTFADIEFQTDKTLGTHVLSPDQVGRRADEEAEPFYPALIYFNGERVEGDSQTLRRVLGRILERDYSAVEKMTGIRTDYH